ncbi:MAG: hypothetical protein KF813_03065 [Trueperaceae bacterium]|nr:hypothetical protein [Trueperaceae bacterium]
MLLGFDQAFAVYTEDAAFVWSVELLATLGDRPGLFIDGPDGEIASFAAAEVI